MHREGRQLHWAGQGCPSRVGMASPSSAGPRTAGCPAAVLGEGITDWSTPRCSARALLGSGSVQQAAAHVSLFSPQHKVRIHQSPTQKSRLSSLRYTQRTLGFQQAFGSQESSRGAPLYREASSSSPLLCGTTPPHCSPAPKTVQTATSHYLLSPFSSSSWVLLRISSWVVDPGVQEIEAKSINPCSESARTTTCADKGCSLSYRCPTTSDPFWLSAG